MFPMLDCSAWCLQSPASNLVATHPASLAPSTTTTDTSMTTNSGSTTGPERAGSGQHAQHRLGSGRAHAVAGHDTPRSEADMLRSASSLWAMKHAACLSNLQTLATSLEPASAGWSMT